MNRYESILADVFTPTAAVTAAGHARPYEQTLAWLEPILPRVPVTRLVDVTPIDVLDLPVWSAVTPLAKDLTVHAGKGATAAASKISAVMEAIERVSAERVADELIRRASFSSLSAHEACVDPEDFDLPFGTTYSDDAEIGWITAIDLVSHETVWVPLDVVISPASEGVAQGVETNGLAAGNTVTEAVLHALYEVVERDAIARDEFHGRYGEASDARGIDVRVVDPATLPPDAGRLVGAMEGPDRHVAVQVMPCDLGVSVFAAYIFDAGFPGADGEVSFGGYGADLGPRRAVTRALTEVAQSHAVVMLGARDAFEGTEHVPDRAQMLIRRLDVLYPPARVPFPEAPAPTTQDLSVDLREVVAGLEKAGFPRCLVVDLTRADLGVPVVRVLVPGLAAPYGASARRPGPRLLQTLV